MAVKLYLGASFEEAREIASQYPERLYDPSEKRNWLQLVRALEAESAEQDDYRNQLNNALGAFFSGDAEEIKAIQLPAIKAFIEAEKAVY